MIQPLTVGDASQNGNRIKLTSHDSGNFTLTIPSAIANAIPMTSNSEITFEITNGTLILKAQEKTEYTLDELLTGITPENCHGELDWGNPVGQEQW
jgi:antitoxin MazE